MRLNDTCIPNTDPNTGEICLYISGQPAEKRPRRSLKESVESEPYEDSSDKVSLVTSTDVTSTDVTSMDQDTRVLSLSELMMDIFCHELNKSLFVSRKTIYNLRLV